MRTLNCAPFLAHRTLLQLSDDVKGVYPIGAEIIKQNLYVDDILAGHTIEESKKSMKELISAMNSAVFELRKWSSNDPNNLRDLPPDSLLPVNWLDLSEGTSTKTLGIRWNIAADNFTFTSPPIEEKELCTKREVLSTIAKFWTKL